MGMQQQFLHRVSCHVLLCNKYNPDLNSLLISCIEFKMYFFLCNDCKSYIHSFAELLFYF